MGSSDIQRALSLGRQAVEVFAGEWKVHLSLRSGGLTKLVSLGSSSAELQEQKGDEETEETDWAAGDGSEFGIPIYSTYQVKTYYGCIHTSI